MCLRKTTKVSDKADFRARLQTLMWDSDCGLALFIPGRPRDVQWQFCILDYLWSCMAITFMIKNFSPHSRGRNRFPWKQFASVPPSAYIQTPSCKQLATNDRHILDLSLKLHPARWNRTTSPSPWNMCTILTHCRFRNLWRLCIAWVWCFTGTERCMFWLKSEFFQTCLWQQPQSYAYRIWRMRLAGCIFFLKCVNIEFPNKMFSNDWNLYCRLKLNSSSLSFYDYFASSQFEMWYLPVAW